MIVNYDTEKINHVLQSFYNATGINIQLRKNDFSTIANSTRISTRYCRTIQKTEAGMNACRASDMELIKKCSVSKRSEMHICHAGLVDVAVPIMNKGVILGYIILGQMRTNQSCDAVAPDMLEHYLSLPVFDEEKINSIIDIATILAEHILLGNMLNARKISVAESIEAYITDNLESGLSVKDICDNIGISKSALYNNIHTYYDCTVSEYINRKRTEKAAELLGTTDYSIEHIAQICGFSATSYFSKTFKDIMGSSPLKYRKMRQSH